MPLSDKTKAAGSRKRAHPDETSAESSAIYWRLNCARFELHLRDEAVLALADALADQVGSCHVIWSEFEKKVEKTQKTKDKL